MARVLQDTITNFNLGNCTLALALDFSKAFDKVWLNGLTYKILSKHHLPPFAATLLHSYLMHRTSRVRVDGSRSKEVAYHAGVPQGSVLSPTLFNLYISDFPQTPTTKLALFADDSMVYAHAQLESTARKFVQRHISKITPWCKKWKLHLNHSKCESILLTRKHKPIPIRPLCIKKVPIPVKDKIKYLGVTIDKRVNLSHIAHAVSKAFVSYRNLYSILSPPSPLSLENKVLVYKQIIRPAILYAAPILARSSDTQLARIQIMQNRILRCITKSRMRTRITDMHRWANIDTIKQHVFKLAEKFYTTLVYSSPLTSSLTQTRYDPNVHRINKPLYHRLPLYLEPFIPP